MIYTENRALYYSMFVSGLTGKDTVDVYRVLAPVFLLDPSDPRMLKLLGNETLETLDSSESVGVYYNYVRSFCTDETAFGKTDEEAEALGIKVSVAKALEEFDRSLANNKLMTLADSYDRLRLSVVYALTLYTVNGSARRAYIQALKRAVSDSDGIDACIALMYFEPQQAAERFGLLKAISAVDLYPELPALLAERYGIQGERKAHGGIWD